LKKALMTQIWRIQATQGIFSPFFWSLTLAGVFYKEYMHVHFVNWGIVRDDQVGIGTFILFLLVLLAFLALGVVYDVSLKLWKEQTSVAYERNPYTQDRIFPKEVVVWRMQIETLRQIARDKPEALRQIALMESWIEDQIRRDKALAAGVEKLESYGKRGAPGR